MRLVGAVPLLGNDNADAIPQMGMLCSSFAESVLTSEHMPYKAIWEKASPVLALPAMIVPEALSCLASRY